MVDKKQVNVLSEIYRKRIQSVALGHEQTVELSVKHGSGKTLELLVVVPGVKALTHFVVRLHRKLHKTFYAIVAAAKEWLAHYKALFAPVVQAAEQLFLPAEIAVPVKTTEQMLATAKQNIATKDTRFGYEKKAASRTKVAAQFHSSDNIYNQSLIETATKAGLL